MAAKISLPRPVDVSPRRELQPERERERGRGQVFVAGSKLN